MKRIGLFGGSFDPVHYGHLLAGQTALEMLELDRLFFIPTATSPFKPERRAAPGELRLKMLRRALAGVPECEVDDRELRRGGVSYTVETLQEYAREHPEAHLHLLIGSDNVIDLPEWRSASILAELAEFVAISRPGEDPVEPPAGFKVRRLEGFQMGISSSEIRRRVKAGRPIRWLVPPEVAEAVMQDRLYLS